MSDPERKVVQCGTHGSVGPAFVCCHLIRDELAPAGFNEQEPEPDDHEPVAWCDDCNIMIEAIGEWTEQVDSFANMKLVCEFCFANLRERHQRQ